MTSATLLHFTVSRTNQTPKILSTIPTHPICFSTPQSIRFPPPTTISPIKVSSQPLYDAVSAEQEEEEDAIGDCLVYEEGIFDDPFLQDIPKPSQIENYSSRNRKTKPAIIPPSPENLIPEKWMEIQKELNITKKERRKITQGLEFGRKVESRRKALLPIDSEEYEKFKNEKLKQLNPVVLDNPIVKHVEEDEKDDEDERGGVEVRGRVAGRNPRLAVYGGGLEDISEVFSSGSYDPSASKDSKVTSKLLFTKEEKILLNRRVPDLAVATSGKWHPLHTLAASGEFYLVNSLLKHNIDINVPDKDRYTAVHKAILGKKQAIFNYLLRESANPFIRDEDGATLLHYAVFAASSQMIKILLLYNVDINLQDNDGWTALHLAVQSRRTDIVRLLLIKGADKTLKNKDGLTPLDICLYSGRDIRTYELIKLLKHIPREK